MSFLEFTYRANCFTRMGAIVMLVTLTLSLPAHAAVQWRRVGTVNGTLTNGQICYTNGQDILCDTNAPTLSGTNLGIGTTSPNNALTVNGTVGYMLGTDLTTTGSQNDVAIGMTSAVRYNGAANATFTGISAGANGQILYLHNPSSYTLTLSNQSISSSAVNRIVTGTGADLSVPSNTSVTLQYDGTAAVWRVTGSSNSANTLAAGTTGQVQFNGGTNLAADSNFFWDNTNKRLGIGSTSPTVALEVVGKGKISTGLITPLIYPASDSTTAIQFDKADGTTNVMDIDTTNGRVGIGSTIPAKTLDVVGTGKFSTSLVTPIIYPAADSTSAISFNKADGTTNVVTVDTTNGRVGIGSASPSTLLNIMGSTPVLTIKDTAGGNPVGNGPQINLIQSKGSITGNGDTLGKINFSGTDGTLANTTAATITGYADSGWGGGGFGYGAIIFTTRSGSNFTEKMRLSSSGNFGIGTSSPLSTLSVNGGVAVGTYAGLNASSSGNLIVSGNVGIGTTSPGSKFQVNGGTALGYATSTTAPSNGLAVSGGVAVGTTTVPASVTASVNGIVQVAGTGSEPCTAAQAGSMRYNPVGQYMEICTYP
jgi:hypothetical protein